MLLCDYTTYDRSTRNKTAANIFFYEWVTKTLLVNRFSIFLTFTLRIIKLDQ
jgi:hypothetical protein